MNDETLPERDERPVNIHCELNYCHHCGSKMTFVPGGRSSKSDPQHSYGPYGIEYAHYMCLTCGWHTLPEY